jgi:hypothetical protein
MLAVAPDDLLPQVPDAQGSGSPHQAECAPAVIHLLFSVCPMESLPAVEGAVCPDFSSVQITQTSPQSDYAYQTTS